MSEVWVVDDDQSMRWVLERSLGKDGFSVESFASPREALARLQTVQPKVILSDIRMPGMTGLEFLEQIRATGLEAPVIIMTAYSDLDSAVSAFQGGAYEYLAKPFDLPAATELVRRALTQSAAITNGNPVAPASIPELMGQAPAMQEVFRAIGRLSNSSATVLVTGESGTGKELVARALHTHSPRKNESFVALNTAAIPKDLLESELFGHERGAFTGAQAQRRGRFEQAEGGTLFLDEIGDMPAELQTRLLRVLSDGHFYRVGGHQPIRSNVRVIAATHQNLEQRVAQGLFREDLFHRLNVIRLRLPSLRERRDDVDMLVQHFLRTSAQQLGIEPKRLTPAALELLRQFSWPGNVRQLENQCHWLNVMAPGQLIDVADLPQEIRNRTSEVGAPLMSVSAAPTHSASSMTTFNSSTTSAYSEGQNSGASSIAVATNPVATQKAGGNGSDLAELELLSQAWLQPLRQLAANMLVQQPRNVDAIGHSEMMDQLTKLFETHLISTALTHTRGRRIEAAQRLGIGRNTITRKIQELNIKE
jgi:two-component system, NtrC family, nitrogen regulation response regulator GlnG